MLVPLFDRLSKLPSLAALALLGLTMAGLTGCQGGGHEAVGSQFSMLNALPSSYRELFDAERPAHWKEDHPASWSVVADRYQAHTKDDAATSSLYLAQPWTNLYFEVDYLRNVASVGAGGMVIRATDNFRGWVSGSAYMFALGSDGAAWQFAIYRQVGGTIEYLKEWTASEVIADSTNKLAVFARDSLLQFYINGQMVWEGHDDALASGYIGLFASTSSGNEALHSFDYVGVKPVPEQALSGAATTGRGGKAGEPGPAVMGKDKSPVLRPGLLVRVTVLVSGKREIDAEVKRVSDNNLLDLPLIGPVAVQGMTLSELNSTLQTRYQDYFIDPQVLAEFVFEERPDAISPWGSVVVLGRVKTPGRVNIPPTQDLTVSGAIQQAGGLDTSAKSSAIRLTRRKPDGSTERITVDFSAVGQQGTVENDLILKPGDLIFVPERVF